MENSGESQRDGSSIGLAGSDLGNTRISRYGVRIHRVEQPGLVQPLRVRKSVAAVVCLAVFATIEYRSAFSMVPLALFKNLGFSGTNSLTLLLYTAIGIFLFLSPGSRIFGD